MADQYTRVAQPRKGSLDFGQGQPGVPRLSALEWGDKVRGQLGEKGKLNERLTYTVPHGEDNPNNPVVQAVVRGKDPVTAMYRTPSPTVGKEAGAANTFTDAEWAAQDAFQAKATGGLGLVDQVAGFRKTTPNGGVRYSDGKGSFMESDSPAKGGTLSEMSGPVSGTPGYADMSTADQIAANVQSYRDQAAALNRVANLKRAAQGATEGDTPSMSVPAQSAWQARMDARNARVGRESDLFVAQARAHNIAMGYPRNQRADAYKVALSGMLSGDANEVEREKLSSAERVAQTKAMGDMAAADQDRAANIAKLTSDMRQKQLEEGNKFMLEDYKSQLGLGREAAKGEQARLTEQAKADRADLTAFAGQFTNGPLVEAGVTEATQYMPYSQAKALVAKLMQNNPDVSSAELGAAIRAQVGK